MDADGHEVEGEVIVFSTKTREVRFFDSDTVSCIANLALMTEVEEEALDTTAKTAPPRSVAQT
ncbi:hypothetical protein ACC720_35010 [Rhizobium ruizarguesonis]